MLHQDPVNNEREIRVERHSTDQELVEFIKGNVYQDFCIIAEQRREVLMNDLMCATNMEIVNRLQGELRGIKFWEEFPKHLLKAIVEDKEDATTTDQ